MFVFDGSRGEPSALLLAINAAYRVDETDAVNYLLENFSFSRSQNDNIKKIAIDLVTQVRKKRLGRGGIDAFLYQYSLSSEEGIALMCMAEALLRIPDTETIDQLIRDKLVKADWQSSLRTDSMFVNAATWGLMLTGKVLSPTDQHKNLRGVLGRFIERTGEPVIRKIIREAMRILGKQFILGQDMDEALYRASKDKRQYYRFSYDMLGEAALTQHDADRFMQAYIDAIHRIGSDAGNKGPIESPGISIKLSALHPRYEVSMRDRCVPALTKSLLTLAQLAKQYNIGLTVDAEEADRLALSLDIIEAVFRDPSLEGWEGFGLAVQAYQKRAPFVLDWLVDLSQSVGRKIMVRLVKGAYWDTEIKLSQVGGLEGYPVYTRKVATDVSYLLCAQKMIAAQNEIYPQFATHNAHTVAAIITMMDGRSDFEFQCLQGMGSVLYDHVTAPEKLNVPCRIYAPVGTHQDLLPYLVRRLLENGANTSFVNRIVDEKAPLEELISDPVAQLKKIAPKPHPRIPLPIAIYCEGRNNSRGLDLDDEIAMDKIGREMDQFADKSWQAKPSVEVVGEVETQVVKEPRDNRNTVGEVTLANAQMVQQALQQAVDAHFAWDNTSIETRANCLRNAADMMEENYAELLALLCREGGKTLMDGVAEVREAVDFCRYYAEQGELNLVPHQLPGPTGEDNSLQLHGRGVIACISPWNFPLAIFIGQVTAALVAGNCVIAKPAAQTPLVAAYAVDLLHQAGVPKAVLQLMPGRGSVIGNALVEDNRVAGILFTGSTETAWSINQKLAARKGPIVPFVAETGGQNAMIVDSSALPEQLVQDVISSAFHSAGQRCSALRVLFVQQDIADKVINMLVGAMQELRVGDPGLLKTDVGPAIDSAAVAELNAHIEQMKQQAILLHQVELGKDCKEGSFIAPCAFEIPSISVLEKENFGPILHVVRYARDKLDQVIQDINNTGYGLTLGIHSRIDLQVDYIQRRVRAGNAYVNRNMIGAVVGVQPFGGEGLSGTGPKAGGPHYLYRMCTERTLSVNTTASGGNASLLSLAE